MTRKRQCYHNTALWPLLAFAPRPICQSVEPPGAAIFVVELHRYVMLGALWGLWHLPRFVWPLRSLSPALAGCDCQGADRDGQSIRSKQITAWSRLFALFAMALLVVASLPTGLLLRGDQHARALLRRVASRRRGRCELSLISAMISLLHQEPRLYEHLAPRIKLKLGDLANVP
jgi:hypothetical protein